MERQTSPPEPQRPPGAHVQPPIVYVEPRWEYRHLVRDLAEEATLDETELNALGAKGWELVAVLAHGSTAHFYFKRQKE